MRTTDPKNEIIDYPTGDGKPVAETETHFRELIELVGILDRYYRDCDDVYVCGNNFVYYEEGNPTARFSPDVYVALGASKIMRDCYKSWEEGGRVPSLVFEMTSSQTKDEDLGEKKKRCEFSGVEEYFLYDPRGEYLNPVLQGFHLQHNTYLPIRPEATGRLRSRILELDVYLDDSGLLRLIAPESNEPLMRTKELWARFDEKERAQR
jgi:Uma2 family endonuclease